ncbi:MAG: hypothetical protein RIM84_18675 [Alphaproteobacteria bacterium]
MRQPLRVSPSNGEFRLDRFLVGQTKALGFFLDRFGIVRRSFEAGIEGR